MQGGNWVFIKWNMCCVIQTSITVKPREYYGVYRIAYLSLKPSLDKINQSVNKVAFSWKIDKKIKLKMANNSYLIFVWPLKPKHD
jgi:hypothetical protein